MPEANRCVVYDDVVATQRFLYRPTRGVIRMPNGIGIDFGPGETKLSGDAISLTLSACKLLGLLQRTANKPIDKE